MKYGYSSKNVNDEINVYIISETSGKIEKIRSLKIKKTICDTFEFKMRITLSDESQATEIKAVCQRAAIGKEMPENYKFEFMVIKTLKLKQFTPGMVLLAAKHTELSLVFYDRKESDNYLTFDNAARVINQKPKLPSATDLPGRLMTELYKL